jgi:hypothetical protein
MKAFLLLSNPHVTILGRIHCSSFADLLSISLWLDLPQHRCLNRFRPSSPAAEQKNKIFRFFSVVAFEAPHQPLIGENISDAHRREGSSPRCSSSAATLSGLVVGWQRS